jgi:hypothetical protein
LDRTWTYINGQRVSQAWNATVTMSGSTTIARDVDYNDAIVAGASTTFGFIGSWAAQSGTSHDLHRHVAGAVSGPSAPRAYAGVAEAGGQVDAKNVSR